MSTLAARLPRRFHRPRLGASSGITAIVVKELRGRMRGRRAFVILTVHVLLLAVFAWMLERLSEEDIARMSIYGGQAATYASATVGRGVFSGLLMLQTLMVAVLAPAATAGAISSEREHQTLELLTVTPISSIAIVLGKLVSALAWIFVLVLASIPVTALVFVFGGVAPDDVVRGYIVLFATVIGLGSIGIFFSALTRRTGAATGLTFVSTLAMIVGTAFLFVWLATTAASDATGFRKMPSQALLWLNPFVAQADVACGTEDGTSYSGYCGFVTSVLGASDQVVPPPINPGGPVPAFGAGGAITLDDGTVIKAFATERGGIVIDPNGGVIGADVVVDSLSFRDRLWPQTVISFLVLAVVMTLAAVQFVSPTRRLRLGLPGGVRRRILRRSAP
jgi:ABC-2 type transport system permease protein